MVMVGGVTYDGKRIFGTAQPRVQTPLSLLSTCPTTNTEAAEAATTMIMIKGTSASLRSHRYL